MHSEIFYYLCNGHLINGQKQEYYMQEYKSTYSKGMALSTAITAAVIVAAIILCAVTAADYPAGSEGFVTMAVVSLLLTGILTYAFLRQLKSLAVADDHVAINRKLGSEKILRKDIVRVWHKKDIRFGIKNFGINGLFGYNGTFWDSVTGSYYACANNGNNLVAIKTKGGKTYVASCDDYNTVINELSRNAEIRS